MTRPVYSAAREARIEIRCSKVQKALIEKAAREDGQDLTPWALGLLLGAASEPMPKQPPKPR